MRLRRRIVPPIVGVVFSLVTASPLVTGWPNEADANKWTLFTLVGMFGFLALIFLWMRQRMADHVRKLTWFGAALVDFFTAVVIIFLSLVLVFGVSYSYARTCSCKTPVIPFWLRLSDRSVLIGGAAFVLATGGAVALEMQRAGARLSVHEDEK